MNKDFVFRAFFYLFLTIILSVETWQLIRLTNEVSDIRQQVLQTQDYIENYDYTFTTAK